MPGSANGPAANAWGAVLTSPVIVRHQGLLVLLAREVGRVTDVLYFQVFDPAQAIDASDAAAWNGWYRFTFPEAPPDPADPVSVGLEPDRVAAEELRPAGMDLLTVGPTVASVSPADGPFEAVSDDRHLYCFRPSTSGTLYLTRLVLTSSKEDVGEHQVTRYAMSVAWEVRYQRSGLRDVPLDDTDSASAVDLTGRPFFEPTVELAAVSGAATGRVGIARVPTGRADLVAWYVAVTTAAGVQLTRFDQTDVALTDFTTPPVTYTPIAPALAATGPGSGPGSATTPLAVSQAMAPELLFYAEQDQVATDGGDEVELQRQGRLMLAIPVSGAGLTSAMAVYDYCVGVGGAISDLTAAQQGLELVDGTLQAGTFVPDTSSPSFPTQDQAAACVHVVDGLVVNQMLLGQVAPSPSPAVDPYLRSGDDGLVHLYYGGPPATQEQDEITGWHGLVPGQAQALVAQFDPRVSRLVIDVPWRQLVATEQPPGAVHFTAAQAGAIMAGTTVEVRDSTFSAAAPADTQADLCDVVISYPAPSGLAPETWVGVPRETAALVATLDGGATDDSADPAVLAGDRPWFDFGGDHPLVRIPLATGVASTTEHAPHGLLATVRPSLPLASATVTTSGATTQLRLDFANGAKPAVTQVWAGLPAEVAAWESILGGGAAPAGYGYGPGPGSTPVFGLPTTATSVPGPLLMVPNGSGPDLAALTVDVRVSTHDPRLLDVELAHVTHACTVAAVPADVAHFAAALRADAGFVALGLDIDVTGIAGDVAVTRHPVGALDLREAACLFDYWSPADLPAATTAVAGSVAAGTQRHMPPAAGGTPGTAMVGLVATADPPESGVAAYVVNQAAGAPHRVSRVLGAADGAGATMPRSGVWRRQDAHNACTFAAPDSLSVPVVANGAALPQSARLRPAPRFTLEAWAQPTGSDPQRLVTFADQVTPVVANAPKLDYRVALEGQDIVAFGSYAKSPGTPDSSYAVTGVHVGTSALPANAFTWEVWLQPDATAAPSGTNPVPLGGIVQVDVPGQSDPALSIGLRADRRVVVAVSADGSSVTEHLGAVPIPDVDEDGLEQWNHLAVVGEVDATGTTWTVELYVNAVLDSTFTAVPLQSGEIAATITIGRNDPYGAAVYGRLAQLRLWSTDRSVAEIRRSAFVTLDGREPGLLGCWPLTAIVPGTGSDRFFRNVAARTDKDWDATLFTSHQPVALAADDFFLSVVASVGGLPPVEADALLATGRWNHLAVEFEAGGAIELNSPARTAAGRFDWMTCSHSDALVAGSAFAVDAWVIVPAANRVGGTIAGRWAWDNSPDDQSFRLRVTDGGELALDVQLVTDTAGTLVAVSEASTGAALADGLAHHVAAVFDTTPAAAGTPSTTGASATSAWTIAFYVDGRPVGTGQGTQARSSIEVQSTQVDFMVGRGLAVPAGAEPQSLDALNLFRGTIGRLRFWGVPAPVTDLFPEMYERIPPFGPPHGLVARWDFLEQAGQLVADSIGRNDGVLTSSGPWRYLQATSEMSFYANGARVATTKPYTGTLASPTTSGFWLGSPPGGTVAGVAGDVAQVTLWDTLRTVETIQDQQYVPRVGSEPGMLAGWDFTPTGGDITTAGDDITGGGNDIAPDIPAARIVESTAPITNEGASVRNVYGGRITELSQSTVDRIAVGAAVDVQHLGGRTPTAVVKRQFVFDANESFARPIHVGYLDLVWVGQVQTDPTLIGYIEGAPPVPSENLTRPYYLSPGGGPYMTYLDTSLVALVQEAGQQITYSSATNDVGSLDVSAAIGVFGQRASTDLNLIATSDNIYYLKNSIQAQFAFHGRWGTSDTSGFDAKWSAGQRDALGLSGDWEPFQSDQKLYLNPQVGRRFAPDNLGLALVESLTADLYAITFASTGAALGTIVVPNPAIPPDRNLLLFPMNPQDTKAGTLDGKVGLVNDPAYKGADRVRGSFFKPIEAYALAARVERQNEQQRAYAQQFDWSGRGKGGTSGLDPVKANLPVDFETPPGDDGQVATPRSGIVNRYVWSADGGLHAETQAYAATSTRSYSGFRSLGVGGGVTGGGEFYLKLGWAWSLDVLGTHTVDVTVGMAEAESQGVTLDVSLAGEAFLRAYDPGAPADYGGTGAFLPGAAPGKVRQYRFMTFYLPPSGSNATAFTSIVDPTWRQLSNDPTARAMRELNAANPVWRILHRVTYVERVPPPVASRPLFASGTNLRQPVNLEGNVTLLRYVAASIPSGEPLTHVSIGEAVAAVLDPAPTGPGVYPTSVLEQHLSWWRPFLDRARPDAAGATADAAAAAELAALVRRVFDYAYAGYATGVLSPTRPVAGEHVVGVDVAYGQSPGVPSDRSDATS